MKILKIIIWWIFVYLSYVAMLASWFIIGMSIFMVITWGAILSKMAYRKFYKQEKNISDFFLYPLIYISVIFLLFFLPKNTTWVYEFISEEKTIIFQWMQHIWTPKYYQMVKENIDKYRKQWYVIVFEGIKMENTWTGTTVNTQLENIFQATDFMQNKFLVFEWDAISKKYLGSWAINVDISNREIQELYNQLEGSEKEFSQNTLQKISQQNTQNFVNRYIFQIKQKYMTQLDYFLVVLHYNLGLFLSESQGDSIQSKLDFILKDYRDQHLYNQVMQMQHEKIFIIYGEGHLQGFYELFQQDNDVKVQLIQTLYPFKQ